MSEPKGSSKLWILLVPVAALVGGVAWWATRPAEAEQPPPVFAELRGTSFDVAPAKPAPAELKNVSPPEIRKEEPSAPAPIPVVAKAPEKPAQTPAPPADAKPAPGEVPATPKPPAEEEKPELINFSKLAFRYEPNTKSKDARDPFPEQIRAMNGKKVTIDGYMFPVDFEKGKVRSFLLSRGMFGCCFGDTPTMAEIVKVQRADGKPMAFEAVARVTGVLEVGEDFDSDGYVDSIFRIKAEAVGPAPGWR